MELKDAVRKLFGDKRVMSDLRVAMTLMELRDTLESLRYHRRFKHIPVDTYLSALSDAVVIINGREHVPIKRKTRERYGESVVSFHCGSCGNMVSASKGYGVENVRCCSSCGSWLDWDVVEEQ